MNRMVYTSQGKTRLIQRIETIKTNVLNIKTYFDILEYKKDVGRRKQYKDNMWIIYPQRINWTAAKNTTLANFPAFKTNFDQNF